jgi:hypothetical protein
MMFYALMPIAWTLIVSVCWTVCKMAQREGGESSPSVVAGPTDHSTDAEVRVGVRIWDDLPELSVRDARSPRLTTRGVR